MDRFTCPICGGKLHIAIGADTAACEACGEYTKLDPNDVRSYRETYENAVRAMRQGNIAGYDESIRLFGSIAFIAEANEKRAECEKKRAALRERTARQAGDPKAEKRDARLGVILLIVTLLLLAAAIAGAVWLIVQWANGAFSTTATVLIAVAIVAIVALNLFRSRQ